MYIEGNFDRFFCMTATHVVGIAISVLVLLAVWLSYLRGLNCPSPTTI